MQPPLTVRWLTSNSASCFHAVEALLRQQPLAHSLLAEALAAPAAQLRAALFDQAIADRFFFHLVPLAAKLDGNRELARVALTKTMGRLEGDAWLARLSGLLTDLENAFLAVLPQVNETLAVHDQPLKQQWNERGAGLLAGIVQWTDPDILVGEADVVVVHPVLGGGGTAHLPYNSVRIEGLPSDPVPELPEVLRLAWLLSMLNLDLPRYSEEVNPYRLPTLAALVMLPITLAAAENLGLAACDEPTIHHAAQAWLGLGDRSADWLTILNAWWETYRNTKLGLTAGLKALDVATAELGGPSAL